MVVALEWVSKITTVALVMVVPGIIGTWLDRRWGTKYLTLIGLALGMAVGLWHLLRLTAAENEPKPSPPKSENPNGEG